MKRFVKGVCLMGAVALLATSCNKNKDTNSMVYHVSMDPTETYFAQEQGVWDDGVSERIYIDGNYQVNFEAGDELMLFNLDATPANSESAVYTVQAAGTGSGITLVNLDGTGISDEIKDAKYAFYPGANVTTDLSNENRATFTLATTQEYAEGRIAPGTLYMAAKIDKAEEGQLQNDQFAMRNICGILQLQFYDSDTENPKTVSSIELTNSGEMNITGDVNLKVPAVDPGAMTVLFTNIVAEPENEEYQDAIADFKGEAGYNVTNAGKTITMTNVNKTLGNQANPTSFYFVLRPLALKDGFTVTINFTDNTSKTITSTKVNTNTIKPNTFRTFAPMKAN